MTTVALLSCTKSKKAYRCKAEQMYAESPRFRLAYTYASLVADEIYILSAKHGLLPADQQIDPYDESLNEKSPGERLKWKDKVLNALDSVSDADNDDYIIIAGQNYYEHLLPRIKRFWLPLRGKRLFDWARELERLLKLERSSDPTEVLHLLFTGLPRLDWTKIKSIPYSNGIYIMFEKSETYQGMDRIVRVGTHRSQGRLKGRLMDHFVTEDADGSIFRKNIGRAFLNKHSDPYLKAWEIDLSKTGNKKRYAHLIDEQREDELESRITRYLRNNISLICFPVYEKEERLRLEEGIIATLNKKASFRPGDKWLGRSSPMTDIAESGLWNREGLDGRPLADEELQRIKWLCRFGNDFYRFREAPTVQNSGIATANVRRTVPSTSMTRAGGKYQKLGGYLSGLKGNHVRLSFAELENILGFNLPASASKHRAWWGNGGHTQADSWLKAGWRVHSVELGHSVEFIRAK